MWSPNSKDILKKTLILNNFSFCTFASNHYVWRIIIHQPARNFVASCCICPEEKRTRKKKLCWSKSPPTPNRLAVNMEDPVTFVLISMYAQNKENISRISNSYSISKPLRICWIGTTPLVLEHFCVHHVNMDQNAGPLSCSLKMTNPWILETSNNVTTVMTPFFNN